MTHKRITWEMFDCINADKTTAFENLCRLLFKRMFFDKKTIFQSISNNPGVEIAPIYSRAVNKRISFQSKYFTSEDNKYAQIQKSVKTIIANYKGEIDVVYLYSNKKLNTKCKAYINIEKLLNDEKIELVPIVDEEILNTVIEYPELSQMYFNTGRLTIKWFREKFEESKDIIGPRYTPNFNVETEAEKYLNLFINSNKAVKNINGIKKDAINNIKDNKWRYRGYNDLMERVAQYIASIPDVCADTIVESFGWSKNLYEAFEKELTKIEKIIDGKKSKEQELREEDEYKKAADTPPYSQDLLDRIASSGKTKTGKEVYSILNGIFKMAIAHDIITKNPLAIAYVEKHTSKHGKALTKAEEKQLLEALSGTKYQSIMAMSLYTGVRPNELTTIEIQDDFVVARNSKRKGGKIEFKRIPITDMLRPYLKGFDVTQIPGIEYIRDRFNAVLPNHIYYDLRTTFYTRCEECGVAEAARDYFVGHSRSKLNDTYSDLSDEYLLREGKKLAYSY